MRLYYIHMNIYVIHLMKASTTPIVYYLDSLVFYVKGSLCYVYRYQFCIFLHF